MMTTDLSATYDDFVQYSGDGELNENVAELYNNLTALDTKVGAQSLLPTPSQSVTQNINTLKAEINQLADKDVYENITITLEPFSDGISSQSVTIPAKSGYNLVSVQPVGFNRAYSTLYVTQVTNNTALFVTINAKYPESGTINLTYRGHYVKS
jgi:hypothetical protein